MTNVCRLILPVVLAVLPFAASADSWKDEGGHGHEFKEKYWDGNCKVERKLKKNGEYKEKRKCKGPVHGYEERGALYVPAPPAVVVEPGITIQGAVRIPQ